MPTRSNRALLAACVVWCLAGAYLWTFVDRGWIPHDEGTIAQSAERTLRGEMPHRDFDEVYTGGLTYLHAGAMRVAGVTLLAPRLLLFAFSMVFLAAVYVVAERVAPGVAAVVALALAAVWSVPNYFASLPSWYTLFFATFGVWACLRHLDSNRRRWLVVAGVFGGLSILMKVTGLFFVAGAVLFLIVVEQNRAELDGFRQPRGADRSILWLFVLAPTAAVIALLTAMTVSGGGSLSSLQMFVPAVALGLFVAWREWSVGRGPLAERCRSLAGLLAPLLVGVAVPIALFVFWYWWHGGLPELFRGVFILPQRRLTEANINPPSIATLGLAAPYLFLLIGARNRSGWPRWLAALLAAGLAVVLASGEHPVAYGATWVVARAMPLLAVVALVWMLTVDRGTTEAADSSFVRRREPAFLLVAMAAFVSLVQFPYATPTYFCYAAPMVVLAIASLIAPQPRAVLPANAVVAVFFFGFAVLFVNRSYGWNLGGKFIPYSPGSVLGVDRGGLRVSAADKQTYEELVHVLADHVQDGTIYAGPDCPEVYFLSGFPNPTRAIFDFLTPTHQDAAWLSGLLSTRPIRAAVINTQPYFSRPMSREMQAVLEQRFPRSQKIGQFLVRFE